MITGLGAGMIPPNGIAAVADVIPPERRARVVGMLMALTPMSAVVAVPLVALSADLGGWRVPFLVIGSLFAACVLLNGYGSRRARLPDQGLSHSSHGIARSWPFLS